VAPRAPAKKNTKKATQKSFTQKVPNTNQNNSFCDTSKLHGHETAAKVKTELNYLKITEGNFQQRKEESLRKAIDKIDNPPKNLLLH